MMIRFTRPGLVAAALLVLAACDGAPTEQAASLPEISADRIAADIAWLADDARMGREAGSEGYQAAADHVAARFAELGLEPAGEDGGYFQAVPMRASRALAEGAAFVLHGPEGDRALAFGDEFVAFANHRETESRVRAPAVFAGYGVVAPERGHDDYAGLDVAGKIVVLFGGAPPAFPSEIRAHYGSGRTKAAVAAARGAVGIVSIYTERDEQRRPFERMKGFLDGESMTWIAADGTPHVTAPDIRVSAALDSGPTEALFAGAARGYAEIRAAENAGEPVAGFPLEVELTLAQASAHRDLASPNVAAVLRGSDPELAGEHVTMTAHLDHVGTGRPVEGDEIYNGALDNAAGVSVMLAVAEAFTRAETPPRRSILFVALTAEEKGLIGADYFARNPTVPGDSLVANVNLDMPLILYPFADVVAFGAEHSSLGPTAAEAVARLGVRISPDPMPEEGIFTRSDHYRFVEQGVPAVFLITGFDAEGEAGAGEGGEVFRDFLANHYHKPSDDISLPIDYEAGAKFALLNYLIVERIADGDARPEWNADSFFGNLFGPGASS